MNRILGIDIGSTTSAVVVIDRNRRILFYDYRFHSGQIEDTVRDQLSSLPVKKFSGLACTSSTPSIFNAGKEFDTRVSFITAAKHFHPDIRTLLIIGGEKFGLVSFGNNGEYLNYRSNTSCAAGTGSFLDQQVSRLNLESITRFGDMASNNKGNFPKIASRCSVFAKTDLIHAQQEGFSLEEICDGLCYGLAKNVVDAVFDESDYSQIVMAGGVSLNAGVIKHIRQLTDAEIIVDDYSHLYGAIGAALQLKENPGKRASRSKIKSVNDIISTGNRKKVYHNPPLKLELSGYPDFSAEKEYLFLSNVQKNMSPVEVSLYTIPEMNEQTDVYLGVDIGSTSTKAVLLGTHKHVLAGLYTRTSGRPLAAVQTIFEAIRHISDEHLHSFNILGAGTTGSGRKFIGKIIGSDSILDEITAHARAAYELDPEVDTIIEIGGQDSKFTIMKNGIVTLSIMNNVCAAGTGSFIEEQAKKLGCPLSEYAERAARSSSPLTSDRCTVFMERDMNHYLNEGYEKDELLASVLHSIRENYLTKVAVQANIGQKIFFQGATAKNRALVAAFEQKLKKPIIVSKFCHLTGALGVALELYDTDVSKSKFRGIEIYKQEIPVRSEVCELCTNHCKLRVAEVGEETEAYGFLCGRDYHTEKYVKPANSSYDLLKSYNRVFGFSPRTGVSDITIGIPVVLHIAEEKYLWQEFFDLLGFKTICSEKYTNAVREGKKLAGAEFCAPVSAAYGHVHFLEDKADFIFLPVYLEKGRNASTSKAYCFYTQYISSLMASTSKFRGTDRILMPVVRSLKSEIHSFTELTEMIRKTGRKDLSALDIMNAYRTAEKHFLERKSAWRDHFLEHSDPENINVVLLGRPYTVLLDSMNNKIPEIINSKGYNAFYMNMLPEDIKSSEGELALTKAVIWEFASRILKYTAHVAKSVNLYPVLITSFKCTPDSFVIEYFKEIMEQYERPYLILQLDEHDSAVGYETRIEAALRSFRNHFESGRVIRVPAYTGKVFSSGFDKLSGTVVPGEVSEVMQDHELEIDEPTGHNVGAGPNYDLSLIKTGETSKLNGKTILIPGWDLFAARLIEAIMIADGKKAAVIIDTEGSIQRSLNLNTGQCFPLNIIAQNAYEYMGEHGLKASETVIWVPRGFLSCNLTMFPHYIRKILRKYDDRMSDITVYPGNLAFYDFSIKMGVNVYLAYLFTGSLRKIACTIRPYEKEKGVTDRVLESSLDLLYHAFKEKQPKEEVLTRIMAMFDTISHRVTERPKVAIFGDLYARDNEIFNQDLIKFIEANGGEAVPTSYSEYLKIILKQTELRYLYEGRYLEHYYLHFLKYLIPMLERKYNKFFEKYIKNIDPLNEKLFEILEKHHLNLLHRGETVDNILKIENLVQNYSDISLFVQTNPAYCCPSLVTEAMSSHIEKLTGIPVVSIEYDGTGGSKNDDIIPYLKLRKR